MWWCCGRANKHDPGWKVGFHKNKDFTKSDDPEKNKDENAEKNNKCTWWKQIGHYPDKWPKDPNFRQHFVVSEEYERILDLIKKVTNKQKQIMNTPVENLAKENLNSDLHDFKRKRYKA